MSLLKRILSINGAGKLLNNTNMNRFLIVTTMALSMLAAGCSDSGDTALIGKQSPDTSGGKMTPEILWAFGRIGGDEVSPDGTKIL